MNSSFALNLILAIAWLLLTGIFSPLNFVWGFFLGFMALWLVTPGGLQGSAYLRRAVALPGFVLYLLWEISKANLRVAHDALTPRHHMRPGIVAIPLDAREEIEIVLLANLITLTPGSLSVDISDDRKTLYIHAMYVDNRDAFQHKIKKNLEKRLLEILR